MVFLDAFLLRDLSEASETECNLKGIVMILNTHGRFHHVPVCNITSNLVSVYQLQKAMLHAEAKKRRAP